MPTTKDMSRWYDHVPNKDFTRLGDKIDALEIDSGSTTEGKVLTADGEGGTSWENCGSTVIANEELEGTEDGLTELTVDGTKYKVQEIPDGSGHINEVLTHITTGNEWKKVNSNMIDSGVATNGQVLKANGSGGVTWGAVSGGARLYVHKIVGAGKTLKFINNVSTPYNSIENLINAIKANSFISPFITDTTVTNAELVPMLGYVSTGSTNLTVLYAYTPNLSGVNVGQFNISAITWSDSVSYFSLT